MATPAKKLYPPNLEGTIPAFYGTTLVVPFSMNKAVFTSEVKGIRLKIKAVQSGKYLITKDADSFSFDPKHEAIFKFTPDEMVRLSVGQFYKIQLAYVSEYRSAVDNQLKDMVGYFSTIAVVKYTTEPMVFIDGLEKKTINSHNYQYTGVYSQSEKDYTEKAYSYCFNLYDNNLNLIQTSGEKIHNSSLDIELYESHDNYDIE